ncbi:MULTISPECIES: hypothetical protein [Escherichia]|uniref:hypothetical protein n=1 Tax=Escherichia TaxID=561 RepID=UPI000390F770|nr:MULTISPECIES: hypothetical protein [Escherichia]EFG1109372.1 hypothetical protein [Escherichia coli]EQO10676.1 hypothetical protein G704_01672 [Escherichia coli HVH 28 (4-0907367)]MCG2917493.1 hypothetical protein [Escherichia coli]MCH5055431.1 hypothetical protein [Escherichia coli]MEC6248074.1 hypothetical protein [Escherichia coli]
MAEFMLVALKCVGVGWILLTFFIVLHGYIRLVNDGKEPWCTLFCAAFVWVIIGVMPVAVAKMAWRFLS